MNYLFYFHPKETEAAEQYAKRLKDEGHNVQMRNGHMFLKSSKHDFEIGEPPWSDLIISKTCEDIKPLYEKFYAHINSQPDIHITTGIQMVELEVVQPPQTPVEEVIAEQTPEPPPLPTVPKRYDEMPWFQLRKVVKDLTGVVVENKSDALAVLKEKGHM